VPHPKQIVRNGYNQISRNYRDNRGHGVDAKNMIPWLRWIDGRLEKGSRVLELGCGMGIPVAKFIARSHSYLGVDISDVQIRRARELVPQGEFQRADMGRLRFRTAEFDAVLAFYSIVHLPLAEQFPLFRRIFKWLKSRGIFVAILGHGRWTGLEKNWFGEEMFWSHTDYKTYRLWLEKTGFKVIRHLFVKEGKGGHDLFFCMKS